MEVDAGLVRALRADRVLPEAVELVHADARSLDWPARLAEEPPPRRVVANLPYSVATPLLRRLLDHRDLLAGWSVLVQRELARRLLAAPGSRDYGSLAVLHQLAVHVENALDLAPGGFYPVPRVVSSFVNVTPRSDRSLPPDALGEVERIVRAAFAHRRKTLLNSLREVGAVGAEPEALAEVLARHGVSPRARAEDVSAETWLLLARALAAAGRGA